MTTPSHRLTKLIQSLQFDRETLLSTSIRIKEDSNEAFTSLYAAVTAIDHAITTLRKLALTQRRATHQRRKP